MQFTTHLMFLLAVAATAQARIVRRQNLQPFTGNLGAAATPILDSGDAKRPFSVKGDTFVNLGAALQRSCDQQFNACANQANSGADFSTSDCTTQKNACTAASASA